LFSCPILFLDVEMQAMFNRDRIIKAGDLVIMYESCSFSLSSFAHLASRVPLLMRRRAQAYAPAWRSFHLKTVEVLL